MSRPIIQRDMVIFTQRARNNYPHRHHRRWWRWLYSWERYFLLLAWKLPMQQAR